MKGKPEEKGKIGYFKTHKISDVSDIIKSSIEAKQHLFIADMSGMLQKSFVLAHNRQIELCLVHEIIKSVLAGGRSKESAAAMIRKTILCDMRANVATCLYVDTMCPIWKEYELIKDFFDYDLCHANIHNMITEFENHDNFG